MAVEQTSARPAAETLGDGALLDAGVVLGYRPDRGPQADLVLGTGARVRSGSILYAASTIGRRFSTGHHVVVREGCRIGDDVSIWSNTVVDYGCRIGDRVKIHTNCYIAQYTEIEDDAFLAPGVSLANDLYPGDPGSAARMQGPVIGRGAQLGVNVTVLPFVRIGAGAIVGAGSVVARDIPDGVIAVGNPAVALRPVPATDEIRERLLDLAATRLEERS